MKKKKDEVIKSLAIHTKDVGSAEVQIGLLSKKIEKWSEHSKEVQTCSKRIQKNS